MGDHEARTELFENNVTKNSNNVNNNDTTNSLNNDDSMITNKISRNFNDEETFKSKKDNEVSYNDIMFFLLKLYNALKSNEIPNYCLLFLITAFRL